MKKLFIFLVFGILYSVFNVQSIYAGCTRCGSAECGQCSTTSVGWRCSCTYQLDDGTYASCVGQRDSACVPPPTPTPAPACNVNNWQEIGRSTCNPSCGLGIQTLTEINGCGQTRSTVVSCNNGPCAPVCNFVSSWESGCGGASCGQTGQKTVYTLTTCGLSSTYTDCTMPGCPPAATPGPVYQKYWFSYGSCGCIQTQNSYDSLVTCKSKGYGDCYTSKAACQAKPTNTPLPTATSIPLPTPTPCVPSSTYWSGWTACSKSCSSGTQTRTCLGTQNACGSNGCTGPDSQSCNTQACIWFQVDGGGVTAKGMIRSQVPSGEVFVKNIPGVAAANLTVDLNGQPLSNAGNWQAQNSNIETTKDYYTEITSRMIFGVTPNTFTGSFNGVPNVDGYTYYKSTGAIDLPATDLGISKVVLVVEGNVNIRGNVTFGSNGLFILLAKGNINIDPNVSNIQGIYLTQQVLSTGTGNQLKLDGSFIGMAGVNLQRTNGSPSELFVFHPEYLTSLPKYMLRKNVIWTEVAP